MNLDIKFDQSEQSFDTQLDEMYKITYTGQEAYVLPVATAEILGGVKPISKTDSMTQRVGVDKTGGLWTVPGGGGSGGETKTKLITVADITFENDTVIGGENDDISFGDAVVANSHFFYKTPEGEQLKAKRVWGYFQPSADFYLNPLGISIYCADGTPKKWNFGDFVGNNIGFMNFTINGVTVKANNYLAFAGSADLKVHQKYIISNLAWEPTNLLTALPYKVLNATFPHISGFKIVSVGVATIPAGSRLVLRAEVEDNA